MNSVSKRLREHPYYKGCTEDDTVRGIAQYRLLGTADCRPIEADDPETAGETARKCFELSIEAYRGYIAELKSGVASSVQTGYNPRTYSVQLFIEADYLLGISAGTLREALVSALGITTSDIQTDCNVPGVRITEATLSGFDFTGDPE